jgi:hypothetical protein
MIRMVVRMFVVFFVLGLWGCSGKKKQYEYSFYHWKTADRGWPVDTAEGALVKQYGVNHFYLHYLDVDWSESLGIPVPLTHAWPYNLITYADKTYTPVVFITNRTFERISEAWCDTLAHKIAERIDKASEQIESGWINYEVQEKANIPIGPGRPEKMDSLREALKKQRLHAADEIQIDCDWTAGTREKYFLFLKKLKMLYPKKTLSATIRLYPYKYPEKTGVPPVDKGMLMCYNMGSIQHFSTENSVFDLSTLRQYLTNKKYPLQLDVSLPVFGWYVWFRDEKLKGIIYKTEDFEPGEMDIFAKEEKNRYRLKADTILQDNYLREGDVLRREYPDDDELEKALKLIQSKINVKRVALYHWDYPAIKQHEHAIQILFPAP